MRIFFCHIWEMWRRRRSPRPGRCCHANNRRGFRWEQVPELWRQSRCVWGPFKSPAQDMKKEPGAGSKILARNVFTVSLGFPCSGVPTCWGQRPLYTRSILMVCLDCRLGLQICFYALGSVAIGLKLWPSLKLSGAGTRFPIPCALTLWTSIYLLESFHSEHLISRRILRRTSWYPGC